MAHPNEDLLRRGYEAFSRGDMDTLGKEVFADDIKFHIKGKNLLAGDYAGHGQVFEYLGRVMELSGGSFGLEVHDVVANDEHALGLTVHTGERQGKIANYWSVHVWHVRNGRLINLLEYAEQPAFDSFWS